MRSCFKVSFSRDGVSNLDAFLQSLEMICLSFAGEEGHSEPINDPELVVVLEDWVRMLMRRELALSYSESGDMPSWIAAL